MRSFNKYEGIPDRAKMKDENYKAPKRTVVKVFGIKPIGNKSNYNPYTFAWVVTGNRDASNTMPRLGKYSKSLYEEMFAKWKNQ